MKSTGPLCAQAEMALRLRSICLRLISYLVHVMLPLLYSHETAVNQVRMYREAMEHLMAAPASSNSSTCRRKEDYGPTPTSATVVCGDEGSHAKPNGELSDKSSHAGDAGQNGKFSSTTCRNDETTVMNVFLR